MAFPFAAIGTGLGQGIDAIYRHRQIQSALDQIKQRRQAEAFIGSLPEGTLPGSSYISAAGGVQPTSALPQNVSGILGGQPQNAGGILGGQSPAAAPASPVYQGNGDPGTGGRVTGVIPLDEPPVPSGPRTLTENQQDALSRQTAPMTAEQTEKLYRASGAKESQAGVPLQPGTADATPDKPTPGPQSGAAGGGSERYEGPHSPEVHAAAESVGVPVDHSFQFSDQQYNQLVESLFRQPMTFGDVLSRFQKARPGADPGTIGRAAIMTYKMIEQGDAAQNNMGFRVLSSLSALDRLKETQRHNRATEETSSGRLDVSRSRAETSAAQGQERIETTRRGQDIASRDRAAGRAAADLRQLRSLADRAMARAQAQGNRNTTSRIAALRAQISAISAKSPSPDNTDQQKLDNIKKELETLDAGLGR